MAITTSAKRPTVAARRTGYVIAVLLNVAMLYAVNVWPGWSAVWFLTDETVEVLTLVNASIITSLVANAIYVLHDAPWLKSIGDLATTAVGLASMIAMWRVFPFDFGDASFDWALLVRIVLAVGIVGSAIGVLVHLVSLARGPSRG